MIPWWLLDLAVARWANAHGRKVDARLIARLPEVAGRRYLLMVVRTSPGRRTPPEPLRPVQKLPRDDSPTRAACPGGTRTEES